MRSIYIVRLCFIIGFLFTTGFSTPPAVRQPNFPYKKAGLTERQAAAHLLGRFTYGATEKEIDRVVEMGVERWFLQQFEHEAAESEFLKKKLEPLDIMVLPSREIVLNVPVTDELVTQALAAGAITPEEAKTPGKQVVKEKLKAFSKEKNLKTPRQLIEQFLTQKIYRAAYSERQLQEVMTEFWFNHFNVSFTKRLCIPFIPAYERDVIRPNSIGNFKDLLIATAKSPAMLYYLDNAVSVAEVLPEEEQEKTKKQKPKMRRGLNENYARELLELHTLGVDGGYTQNDVTEAARIFTGWGVFPTGPSKASMKLAGQLANASPEELNKRGMTVEGDFLFSLRRHDAGPKTVLGKKFPADRGMEEGVELLSMLSAHPSTASFISRKIATRFVADDPPAALVKKLAETFQSTQGNIQEVLTQLVSSDEFWSTASLRQKIKSPFELAISAIRSLEADVDDAIQLNKWIERMGQRIYYYQPPTGFPDRANHWISTGALLNRMNFGLTLAADKIPGLKFDLLRLNQNHEPGSSQEALRAYARILLPERNQEETIARVTPLVDEPSITTKVDKAAKKADMSKFQAQDGKEKQRNSTDANETAMETRQSPQSDYRLSQIVGIIIGSPEFQRR
jgi:uncharacterized protein (DUF1800 family)